MSFHDDCCLDEPAEPSPSTTPTADPLASFDELMDACGQRLQLGPAPPSARCRKSPTTGLRSERGKMARAGRIALGRTPHYFPPMRRVPTFCENCRRIALDALPDPHDTAIECAACGAAARILPGGSYTEEESAEFLDVIAVVADAQLTPDAALQLLDDLEMSRGSADAFKLCNILLPKLQHLRASSRGTERERTVGMVRTVLNAVGFGPRPPPQSNW